MGTRQGLHSELLKFIPNVYFQPPSNIQMSYPCIVYNKAGKYNLMGNDELYFSMQEYRLMLIERDPDSTVADEIVKHFRNCRIDQYYTVNNLNHTTLELYY